MCCELEIGKRPVTDRAKLSAAGLSLLCLWAAGCRSLWEPGPQKVVPTVEKPPPNGVHITWVPVTPPPPLKENIPDPPSDQHIWIPGRWVWRGNHYIWLRGHWTLPPHPGAKWVPDKWSPGCTTPDVPAHWE
jgi:hypothetical protein